MQNEVQYKPPRMDTIFETKDFGVPAESVLPSCLEITPFWKSKELSEKFKLDMAANTAKLQQTSPYIGKLKFLRPQLSFANDNSAHSHLLIQVRTDKYTWTPWRPRPGQGATT